MSKHAPRGTKYPCQRLKMANVVLPVTVKHFQHCTCKAGKPFGHPDGASSAPAPFQLVSYRRQTNTEATGAAGPWGIALTRTVRELWSHGAALSLHVGRRCLLSVALLPSLSHQSYIIDSESRVMFYKVKHINGFLCALKFRCAGMSK